VNSDVNSDVLCPAGGRGMRLPLSGVGRKDRNLCLVGGPRPGASQSFSLHCLSSCLEDVRMAGRVEFDRAWQTGRMWDAAR